MSMFALQIEDDLRDEMVTRERLRVVEQDDEADEGIAEELGPRVLLAEDDDEMRRLLSEELSAAGYRLTEVRDGRQLLACLRQPNFPEPDLVISDIRMPGVTGLEVLRQLREHDWVMPVILITAFGDRQTHEQARDLGAATVLNKPFDVDELIYAAESIVPVA